MVLVYRDVNISVPSGAASTALTVPAVTLFCAEAVAPLDCRIYELAHNVAAQIRGDLAASEDPRPHKKLRLALGLKNEHARMCERHARVRDLGLQMAGAPDACASSGGNVTGHIGGASSGVDGAVQADLEADHAAVAPATPPQRRRSGTSFERSTATADPSVIPKGAHLKRAFRNPVLSPAAPLRNAEGEIRDPYYGTLSVEYPAEVPSARLRRQALTHLPRTLSLLGGTQVADGYVASGAGPKYGQDRNIFDSAWLFRCLLTTVLGAASTNIPCVHPSPHPPDVSVIREGNDTETSSGCWFNNRASVTNRVLDGLADTEVDRIERVSQGCKSGVLQHPPGWVCKAWQLQPELNFGGTVLFFSCALVGATRWRHCLRKLDRALSRKGCLDEDFGKYGQRDALFHFQLVVAVALREQPVGAKTDLRVVTFFRRICLRPFALRQVAQASIQGRDNPITSSAMSSSGLLEAASYFSTPSAVQYSTTSL